MISPVILQFCDPTLSFVERLTNWMFIRASVCVFAEPMGFLVLGLVVYAAIAIPAYVTTGSIILPVVLLLLVGGAVLPQIAAPGMALAGIALMIAAAGTITYVYYRYSL